MNIETHQPELEALIRQRMATDTFHDVEDALIQALKSAPPPQPTVQPPSNRTGADLIVAMRALPYKDEIDSKHPRSDHESSLMVGFPSATSRQTEKSTVYLHAILL